jgi:hypothetical protein
LLYGYNYRVPRYINVFFWRGILLTGETMKSFLERLAARDELPSASSGLSLSKAAESEGAVLFAAWVWGKPQP